MRPKAKGQEARGLKSSPKGGLEGKLFPNIGPKFCLLKASFRDREKGSMAIDFGHKRFNFSIYVSHLVSIFNA